MRLRTSVQLILLFFPLHWHTSVAPARRHWTYIIAMSELADEQILSHSSRTGKLRPLSIWIPPINGRSRDRSQGAEGSLPTSISAQPASRALLDGPVSLVGLTIPLLPVPRTATSLRGTGATSPTTYERREDRKPIDVSLPTCIWEPEGPYCSARTRLRYWSLSTSTLHLSLSPYPRARVIGVSVVTKFRCRRLRIATKDSRYRDCEQK